MAVLPAEIFSTVVNECALSGREKHKGRPRAPFPFCFTPHVLSLSLAVQRKCRAAGDLVIEGTESNVHSTEESDDFVKQFHDDFLDKECVLVNLFCDLHHKNKSTLHFLTDQQK